MSESEAFPGQVFSGGENNGLNYFDDPARTEYTGERLGHQSKSGMITASKSDEPILPDPALLDSGDLLLRQVDQAGAIAGGSARIEPAPLTTGDIELGDIRVAEMTMAPVPPAPRKQKSPAQSEQKGPAKPIEPGAASKNWRLGLFLASYRSEAVARDGWKKLKRQYGKGLDGLSSEILKVDLGPDKGGIYYRLFAVPTPSESAAAALCRTLENGGQFCRTARSGGRINW